jgi:DNA-binding winged helix-turn-helix (wHTH) protein
MTLSFGPFVLNEDARELLRDGQPVSLQPRALELLFYLARNRDRTVRKDELLDTLWPNVTVTDASIERAVSLVRSELRKCHSDPSEDRLSVRAARHRGPSGRATRAHGVSPATR